MKRNSNKIWVITAVVALAVFGGMYYQKNSSGGTHTSSNLTLITDAGQLSSILEKSKERLLVIDLYADWCAPCRVIAPILDELAVKYSGNVDFYRVNVDQNKAVANFFKVSAIPYVVYVKNGIVVDALTGANSTAAYENTITNNL
ncbi:MAG: thioredoxin domain-containing protein [Fibrobacterota bacterium]